MERHGLEPLLGDDDSHPSWVSQEKDEEYQSDYRDFHNQADDVVFDGERGAGAEYDHDDGNKANMEWHAEDAPPSASNVDASEESASRKRCGGGGCCGGRDEEPPTSVVVMLRLANIAAAGLLLFCSVNVFLSLGMLSLSNFVLSGYALVLGLLSCCHEIDLSALRIPLASNFGFFYNPLLKLLFYLLLAMVAFTFGTPLGYASTIILGALALINAGVLCRYPGYAKVLREISNGEGEVMEAKIRKETKKQAYKSAMGRGAWWSGS